METADTTQPENTWIALASWLVGNVLALAVVSGSALIPRGGEILQRHALEICWAIQLLGVSLLFPWLLSNLRRLVVISCFSVPTLQLAGVLQTARKREVLIACGLMMGLQAALSVVSRRLPSRRLRAWAVGIAAASTVSALTLAYLNAEF